jgi:glutamyl/glutaminyl-tRNA synthetase
VWDDLLAGRSGGPVAPAGDLVARDRHGGWTYGFCVVVDDLRQGVDLVVRGRDLLHATPSQLRLAGRLGRATGARFLHHPLIRRPDGSKLSKSSGDTGVRELRAAGHRPAAVIEMALAAMAASAPPAID